MQLYFKLSALSVAALNILLIQTLSAHGYFMVYRKTRGVSRHGQASSVMQCLREGTQTFAAYELIF